MISNYDRIKQMDIDKMAEFLMGISSCYICSCNMEEYKCERVGCKEGIKQWLLKDSEE